MIRNVAEPMWFKSSYSSSSEGDSCVEIAVIPGTVLVRDSKQTDGPRLTVVPEAWSAFLPHVRHQDGGS